LAEEGSSPWSLGEEGGRGCLLKLLLLAIVLCRLAYEGYRKISYVNRL
jgi:hypothetical protein